MGLSAAIILLGLGLGLSLGLGLGLCLGLCFGLVVGLSTTDICLIDDGVMAGSSAMEKLSSQIVTCRFSLCVCEKTDLAVRNWRGDLGDREGDLDDEAEEFGRKRMVSAGRLQCVRKGRSCTNSSGIEVAMITHS